MCFNSSLQVALGLANITSIAACTGKLGLSVYNWKNAAAILPFLQYASQTCLILIAFEKAPMCDNSKYTFHYFIRFIKSVFIAFVIVLNFEKLFYLVIYNISMTHNFCKIF